MKKAYFIDLDNTLYFTKPYVDTLLGSLYNLLAKEDLEISKDDFIKAKEEMLTIPFQKVALKYNFKQAAVNKALEHLKEKELTKPMDVHGDYHFIKALKGLKIIVTAGFEKMQRTKIAMLGILADFDEVYVLDHTKMEGTKKDVFLMMMTKYNLKPTDVLVIGDDAESEIKFGLELGMETLLFDPENKHPEAKTSYRCTTFKDIANIKA